MAAGSALGSRVRALRRAHRLTQAELARRLFISPSYLNLLEHNRRSVSGELLVKLASVLPVDLTTLSAAQDSRLVADLLEAFSDSLFEDSPIVATDLRELAATCPSVARAIGQLYEAYRATRESLHGLAAQVVAQGGDVVPSQRAGNPTEEVSDFLQQRLNYFPDLEEGAETLRGQIDADNDALFAALSADLAKTIGAEVRIEQAGRMGSALRRYDRDRHVIYVGSSSPRQQTFSFGASNRTAHTAKRARSHRRGSDLDE
jgi:transcriptional regulator with XRE-family HTH domain